MDIIGDLATFAALGGAAFAARDWAAAHLRMPVARVMCAVAPDLAVQLGLGAYTEPAEHAPAAPDYAAFSEEEEGDMSSPLHAEEWLHILNDEPDVVPHIAMFGPSGSGKSTLILALLKARDGLLVITTPKNAADDPWGGFPAVRLAMRDGDDGELLWDWAPIHAAIMAVYREAMLRHADGGRPRTPLTLVIDELTTTIAAAPDPRQFVARLIDLWLTARSVKIRLVVGDPTANVRGWGIEGRGDVRQSIAFVRCDRDKSAAVGELDECRAGKDFPMDTRDVLALAAGRLDAGRLWVPERRAAPQSTPRESLWSAPTSAQATRHEAAQIRAWSEEGVSLRELARRLYRARGGDDPTYDGSGAPFIAVRGCCSE